MGIIQTIIEIPEFLSYMFLPTLTEEEWEQLNLYRLAAFFFLGIVIGMSSLALYFLINDYLRQL
jgi:hypothetical protein